MKIQIINLDTSPLEFRNLKKALAVYVWQRKSGNVHCRLDIFAESAADLERMTKIFPPRLLAHVQPTRDYSRPQDSPFRDANGRLTKAFRVASKKFHEKRVCPVNQDIGGRARLRLQTPRLP